MVTKSGACYSFGRGEYGRLGLGDTRSRYKPQEVRARQALPFYSPVDLTVCCGLQVEALKGKIVVQAACGGSHSLFLTKDGEAYSSGRAE